MDLFIGIALLQNFLINNILNNVFFFFIPDFICITDPLQQYSQSHQWRNTSLSSVNKHSGHLKNWRYTKVITIARNSFPALNVENIFQHLVTWRRTFWRTLGRRHMVVYSVARLSNCCITYKHTTGCTLARSITIIWPWFTIDMVTSFTGYADDFFM